MFRVLLRMEEMANFKIQGRDRVLESQRKREEQQELRLSSAALKEREETKLREETRKKIEEGIIKKEKELRERRQHQGRTQSQQLHAAATQHVPSQCPAKQHIPSRCPAPQHPPLRFSPAKHRSPALVPQPFNPGPRVFVDYSHHAPCLPIPYLPPSMQLYPNQSTPVYYPGYHPHFSGLDSRQVHFADHSVRHSPIMTHRSGGHARGQVTMASESRIPYHYASQRPFG